MAIDEFFKSFGCPIDIRVNYDECGPEPEIEIKQPEPIDLKVKGTSLGCPRSQLDIGDGEIEALMVFPNDCSGLGLPVTEDDSGMVWVDLLDLFFTGEVDIIFRAEKE